MIKRLLLMKVLILYSLLTGISWEGPVPIYKVNEIVEHKSVVANDEIISIWSEKKGIDSELKMRKTNLNGDFLTEEIILFSDQCQIIDFEIKRFNNSLFLTWAITNSHNSILYISNFDLFGTQIWETISREFSYPFCDLASTLNIYSNDDRILVFCNLNNSIQAIGCDLTGNQILSWNNVLSDLGFCFENPPFDGIWINNEFHFFVNNSKYHFDSDGNLLNFIDNLYVIFPISMCFEFNGNYFLSSSSDPFYPSKIYQINDLDFELVAELNYSFDKWNTSILNDQMFVLDEANIYSLNSDFQIETTIPDLPDCNKFAATEDGFFLCDMHYWNQATPSTISYVNLEGNDLISISYSSKPFNIATYNNNLILSSFAENENPEVSVISQGLDIITTTIGSIEDFSRFQNSQFKVGENSICYVWQHNYDEFRVQFINGAGNILLQDEGEFLYEHSSYSHEWLIGYNSTFLLVLQVGNGEFIYKEFDINGQLLDSGLIEMQNVNSNPQIIDILPFDDKFLVKVCSSEGTFLQVIDNGTFQIEGNGLLVDYSCEIFGNFIFDGSILKYLNNDLEINWEIGIEEDIVHAKQVNNELFAVSTSNNTLKYFKVDQYGTINELNQINISSSNLYFEIDHNGHSSFSSNSEFIFIDNSSWEITSIPKESESLHNFPFTHENNYYYFKRLSPYHTDLIQIDETGNVISEEQFTGYRHYWIIPFGNGLYTHFNRIQNFYYYSEVGMYAYYFDPQTLESLDDVFISPPSSLSNYPNPFNPVTTITFDVAKTTFTAELNIYNVKGQQVYSKHLSNDEILKGKTTWNASGYSSGVYFSEIKSQSNTLKNKMLLLK